MRSRLLAVGLLVLLASNAHAVGYTSRACGFDVDKDGNVGEAGECDYCDGVTTDPDGDGEAEDLIYVDCNSGNDTTGTGTAALPYRTLGKALSSNDGPGDGREDIICARSTCNSTNGSGVSGVTLNESGRATDSDGAAAYVSRTATGNEAVTFQYPTEPFMIVGWDTDNDGAYPPYDTDDEPLIFDAYATGQSSGAANYSSFLGLGNGDNIELAHFTVKNYGRSMSATSGSVFSWSGISGYADRHYLHDIVIENAWRGVDDQDGRRVVSFNVAGAGNGTRYTALENIKWLTISSWPMRGGNSNAGGGGLLRVADSSYDNPDSVSASANVLGFKIWNFSTVEFIDNAFTTGDQSATTAKIEGIFFERKIGPTYIQGNTFTGFTAPILANSKDDANVKGVSGPHYVRRNTFTFANGVTDGGRYAEIARFDSVSMDGQERNECLTCSTTATATCANDPSGGNPPGSNVDCDCDDNLGYFDDIYFTDNIVDFNDNVDIGGILSYQNGTNCASGLPAAAGPLVVANNTFLNANPCDDSSCVDTNTAISKALIKVGKSAGESWDWKYVSGDADIFNNIFSGMNNDFVLLNQKIGDDGFGPLTGAGYYDTGDWFADRNIFIGTTLKFRRGTSDYTGLAAWKTATGEDDNSDTCTPLFASDGYTLLEGDTCARNKAVATWCNTYDFELDTRTSCDIGADEYAPTSPTGECFTSADCNDNNPCTNDVCSGSPTECSHTNNTASCTDSTYCNGADTCSGGTCSVHAGNPCPGADGDSDCSETCNEATDTCTTNDTDGSSCDDGLYCTLTDTCTSGTCSGTSSPCAGADGDGDCTETCDETANDCNGNDPNGSTCTDGLFCTEPDTCGYATAGVCGGPALDCSTSETSCKTGTCDEGTDACITGANKADGTDCNDGTYCNGLDQCASGACTTHAGDPCAGGPDPLCNESTDSCYAFTTDGDNGMTCWGCTCEGCSMK
jgi:hypothetical protein